MNVRTLLAGLVLSASLAATSRAQCPLDDGLAGVLPPCITPNLTVFKQAFQQQSLGICWQQCGVAATANYRAVWSGFIPSTTVPGTVDCAWYKTRLRLYQGLALRWTGVFNVHYARTWLENGSLPGSQVQVWRYLVNGDMRPTSPAAGPCAIPPCAPPHGNRVRFTGYVDIARDCATFQTEQSWMITHACDRIDHDPGFPRAGGGFHPGTYYTFVGPSIGFVPGPTLAQEVGPAPLESVRSWAAAPLPVQCRYEEPAQAQFFPQMLYCLCAGGAPSWYDAVLMGFGVAGTSFTSTPFRPFQSVGIGAWTNPAAYPGLEEVRWNASELSYTDGCTGVTQTENFFGATTIGGNPAFWIDTTGLVVTLPLTFVDQSNSKQLPGVGAPLMNVMYRSDHVISLNL